ncbi:hypothetical protein DPM19_07735 [Actinomadura craniellae]|uniref:DNA-binding response regulator n=1 Tax=Actinomadura craniellae TaxID=2231787 RepID=A0A365H9H2_9ACTN|nr:response regulator transcription factor [Actinomadura craniellae]RAY15669.1 hypothetical protein DPM19_07735 [Actinomadura craniellae]
MRILICDDHPVFADSFSVVLGEAGHDVVGVCYSPDELPAMLRARPADLCLVDLHFPAGPVLDLVPELRAAAPATRLVLLSGSLGPDLLEAGLAMGISGFASKGQQPREILALLDRVHAGEVVVDPLTGSGRAAHPDAPARRPPAGTSHVARVARFLTPREREVLTRLARGESTAALAKAMGVTRSTARSHVQSVLTKLGVHSQREAVVEAARHGLVSVETGEWLIN